MAAVLALVSTYEDIDGVCINSRILYSGSGENGIAVTNEGYLNRVRAVVGKWICYELLKATNGFCG